MTIEGISVFSGHPIRVELEGARVNRTSERPAVAGLPYLAPGFIDMQVNGYRGIDYSSPSLSEVEVGRLVEMLAPSGTTAHLPTIITGPREMIVRNLSVIERARSNSEAVAAAIPGYHIEGPFISPEDGPRGAHSLAHVRRPNYDEYRAWQEAAQGRIKVVTIAPEIEGALTLIERMSSEGVLVAIGHSAAAPEVIREAVKAGASLSTHLGNGSHAMIPRLENYIWEQLGADELTASIICDGFHLPGSVVRTIMRTKGLDRLFLVSDATILGGSEPGTYPWGDITVEVFADGHLGLHKTKFLAGAGHLLDHDAAQFIRFTGADLSDAVRLCSLVPARLLGLPSAVDFLESGAAADFTLFDYEPGAERLSVLQTIQHGRKIYG